MAVCVCEELYTDGYMGSSYAPAFEARGQHVCRVKHDDVNAFDRIGIGYSPVTGEAGWNHKFDPLQAAADFYVLTAMDAEVFGSLAKTIKVGEGFGAGTVKLTDFLGGIDGYNKWQDAEWLAACKPKNETERASKMLEAFAKDTAPKLLNYLLVAIASELRYHRAWKFRGVAGLLDVIDAIGMEQAMRDVADLFRESGWSAAYGGEAWAVITDHVRWFATGSIDGKAPMDAKLFCDRVFSLQHNTTTVFNKVGWAVNNSYGWSIKRMACKCKVYGKSCSTSCAKMTLLTAHATDYWPTLRDCASAGVRSLFTIYATKAGVNIDVCVSAAPTAKFKPSGAHFAAKAATTIPMGTFAKPELPTGKKIVKGF